MKQQHPFFFFFYDFRARSSTLFFGFRAARPRGRSAASCPIKPGAANPKPEAASAAGARRLALPCFIFFFWLGGFPSPSSKPTPPGLTAAAADAGGGTARPVAAARFPPGLAGRGQEALLLAAQRLRGAQVAAQLLAAADAGPEAAPLVPGAAGQALRGAGRRWRRFFQPPPAPSSPPQFAPCLCVRRDVPGERHSPRGSHLTGCSGTRFTPKRAVL